MNLSTRTASSALSRLSHFTEHQLWRTFFTYNTVCTNFWQCTEFLSPFLLFGPVTLLYIDTTKFLGLDFDRKLCRSAHISYPAFHCTRSPSVLSAPCGTSRRADRTALLISYRSLVRSKLDCRCIVYASASSSTLHCLNTFHHHRIRLAAGAFYTSPVESLYAEVCKLPLSCWQEILLSLYVCSVIHLMLSFSMTSWPISMQLVHLPHHLLEFGCTVPVTF